MVRGEQDPAANHPGAPAVSQFEASTRKDPSSCVKLHNTVALSLPPEGIDFGAEQSTAVFRIFQEVLTNVARHADARNVEVKMREHYGTLKSEV